MDEEVKDDLPEKGSPKPKSPGTRNAKISLNRLTNESKR
jgi:hypothetical protein